MTEQLLQAWVLLTGGASVWLMADPRGQRRSLGCWIGLAGQPAWFFSTYQHFQWGMFMLSVVFTSSFIRGIVLHRFSRDNKK
ncbi:hypothetical protein EDC30_109124 [Paucimonas lemoignei]|uniref:Uncharacterized protein n=1 Tax=Paucimonas lemoignei TaxID=29443 RepID=A0A4R3HUW0_PAULE|nr:hypothetical protein [Paucimonas lemoignei]TCS35825.1 hypothetical protein EDC30_109124 [Paucimonas lemoignei]